MSRLAARQDDIEKQLAARHLRQGGIAMFDLSSSWVEGSRCELAAYGYSRDGKRGTAQIEYGLLTDPDGRPVAVRVLTGNTGDPKTFPEAADACCPALKTPMRAALTVPMWGGFEAPRPGGCGAFRGGAAGGRGCGAGGQVSVTSVIAARAACSSTMVLPSMKVATRACRARLLTARG